MQLKGSCHCGAVKFRLQSDSPVPFMHCYCTICRKTAGGGGYAINLGGDASTMKVTGEKNIGIYHALMREKGKRTKRSPAKRHFCLKCGSALWLWDPRWPELIHPHASAIDTPLPKPPEVIEAALAYAANWVDVPKGKKHVHCREWPGESLREWHQRHRSTCLSKQSIADAEHRRICTADERPKDDLRFEYKGSTFVFANAENRAAFAADPEKYAPQYGGYCAFGTARGYKADIDPATFTVIDGRLYLNYNTQVQREWTADRGKFIRQADERWPTVSKTEKVFR